MNTEGTATRTDDVIASYSSKGPTGFDHVVKPDIVAPGNRIISLYSATDTLNVNYSHNEVSTSLYEMPTNLFEILGDWAASPAYFVLSGTSMAAPWSAGP